MCFPVNIAKFLRTPILKSPLKTLVRPVFENILTSMHIFSKTYFSLHKNNKLKNRTEAEVSQSRVCRNR